MSLKCVIERKTNERDKMTFFFHTAQKVRNIFFLFSHKTVASIVAVVVNVVAIAVVVVVVVVVVAAVAAS